MLFKALEQFFFIVGILGIERLSVIGTNLLILSLNAKPFYMADIWFDYAHVKDCNQATVASIIGEMIEVQKPNSTPYLTFQFAAQFPASEKILT